MKKNQQGYRKLLFSFCLDLANLLLHILQVLCKLSAYSTVYFDLIVQLDPSAAITHLSCYPVPKVVVWKECSTSYLLFQLWENPHESSYKKASRTIHLHMCAADYTPTAVMLELKFQHL